MLQSLSDAQVAKLMGFKIAPLTEQRVHVLACLPLDTGTRIDEALSIERSTDIDWEDHLINVGMEGAVSPS